MDAKTLSLLLAAAPVAVGGLAAGTTYLANKNNAQRRQENLRASARDVLSAGTFGKSLPVAQEHFQQLAVVAPEAMSNPVLARSLVARAVGGEDFAQVAERATNLDRNMHTSAFYRRPKSTLEASTKAMSAVSPVTPLIQQAVETRPSATNSQIYAERALAQLGMHAHGTGAEETLKTIREKSPEQMRAYADEVEKQIAMRAGQMGYHAALKQHGIKTASPNAIGNILAVQYLLCKTACEKYESIFDKTAVSWGDITSRALMGAGVALLGGVATSAATAGWNALEQRRDQVKFDNTFTTAIKRIEKGVSEDHPEARSINIARDMLKNDPVEYRRMAREAFDVLTLSSPELAKSPLVATQFVATVVGSGGRLPETDMRTITKIQETASRRGLSPLQGAFGAGYNAFGGTAAAATAMQEIVKDPVRAEQRAHQLHDVAADQGFRASQEDAKAHNMHMNQMKLEEHKHALHTARTKNELHASLAQLAAAQHHKP